MLYLPALFALACVHLLAAASPGPAFVATVRIAAQSERRSGLLHALGLGMAATVWAAGALLGLQALMVKVTWLYRVLQLAGGLYLLYVGIQAWWHAREELHLNTGAGPSLSGGDAFRRGFATNIANPKVMVFFASIFASLLNPAWPAWVRCAALAIVAVDETGWYAGISLLLSTNRARAGYRRAKRYIERVAGTIMFAFGGKLAWSSLS